MIDNQNYKEIIIFQPLKLKLSISILVLELRLAGIISKLLLSIAFTNTSISLLDQLISLSQLSFFGF